MDPGADISAAFERYEGGSQAAERALIDRLVEKIGYLQHINRDPRTGKLHRGTHAKGLVCASAEFEVFDVAAANPGAPAEVIARLAQGLYRAPGRYPTRARFANGKSRMGDDRQPDERSLSFSVDLGQGARQDFSANSAYVFPIPSLEAFNVVFTLSLIKGARAGTAGAEAKAYMMSRVRNALGLRSVKRIPDTLRTLRCAFDVTRRRVASFRQTRYWSGTAFRHGGSDAVKYIVVPCDGEVLGAPPGDAGPDYLQEDLRNWVNVRARPVFFDFRLQFLDADNMQLAGRKFPAWRWVEDPTLNWDEAGARDYLVGRLTIPAGSISDDTDDPAVFPAFDLWANCLEEHRPLGRINRGRAFVELQSRHNRA
jgi:hypothetical protein